MDIKRNVLDYALKHTDLPDTNSKTWSFMKRARIEYILTDLFKYSFIYLTGCNIGHYGDDCLECPSHCTNSTCQMQVGHCFDCEDGYKGPMCEEGRLIDI